MKPVNEPFAETISLSNIEKDLANRKKVSICQYYTTWINESSPNIFDSCNTLPISTGELIK